MKKILRQEGERGKARKGGGGRVEGGRIRNAITVGEKRNFDVLRRQDSLRDILRGKGGHKGV